MDREYQYDVCLSYASEERVYVKEVFDELNKNDITAYYDEQNRVESWGSNLQLVLSETYLDKAKYCVMFLSENYAKKSWTKLEMESALARHFDERETYILPVKFDDTKFPGIPHTIRYENANTTSPKELAILIAKKLNKPFRGREVNHPLIKPLFISKEEEAKTEFNYLIDKLKEIFISLDELHINIEIIEFTANDLLYRFHFEKKVLFILRIKLIDEKIYFNLGKMQPNNENYNGIAIIKSLKKFPQPILEFINLGFFDEFNYEVIYFTKENLLELIWNQIRSTIELILN